MGGAAQEIEGGGWWDYQGLHSVARVRENEERRVAMGNQEKSTVDWMEWNLNRTRYEETKRSRSDKRWIRTDNLLETIAKYLSAGSENPKTPTSTGTPNMGSRTIATWDN